MSFYRSSSPNFDNLVVQERIIDDREFNSLEEDDQQVILAKNDGLLLEAEGFSLTSRQKLGQNHNGLVWY